ncbi:MULTISPECIES: toll/interleukin-1 receptor domain-containing protein [unclassified Nostoc]|uniref:toll/interleukin-1 receptor domain-containing protein n=1 Tax=unclassified Nostoc TaxID=2593658 RepID=UPI00263736D1|nr:TIR domain-containing protein [Nostoc sp. S13]MDF5734860.1 TIR domain-containing protein [Nostoc sp. S13]
MAKKYDVVLSFASENREYVRAVAVTLQAAGIKVFYDEFEQANLWGKNLYVHLDEIYRNEAHFCVMFISKHYLRKTWTNHERESVQARVFQEKEEYLLPARFDNTEIPGLIPTIGYIDLQNVLPENFAKIVIQKLNNTNLNTSILTKDNPKPIIKLKQTTQTVNFNFEGISQLSNDKPIVYKVLTQGGRNNYTGVAKKGEVYITLQKHLQLGKNYVPGYKVKIERMSTIQEAQKKANRIINRTKPKYNK